MRASDPSRNLPHSRGVHRRAVVNIGAQLHRARSRAGAISHPVFLHGMRGLHTHFPPHEPYIVANDCEYYTVGYSCAIDDAVE